MKPAKLTPATVDERLEALRNGPRARECHVHVALSEVEKRDVLEAATRVGLGVSQYMRVAALEKARG